MRTLGLMDDIASEKAIKLAYRKAAIKWHPDKNAGEQDKARMCEGLTPPSMRAGMAPQARCGARERDLLLSLWYGRGLAFWVGSSCVHALGYNAVRSGGRSPEMRRAIVRD